MLLILVRREAAQPQPTFQAAADVVARAGGVNFARHATAFGVFVLPVKFKSLSSAEWFLESPSLLCLDCSKGDAAMFLEISRSMLEPREARTLAPGVQGHGPMPLPKGVARRKLGLKSHEQVVVVSGRGNLAALLHAKGLGREAVEKLIACCTSTPVKGPGTVDETPVGSSRSSSSSALASGRESRAEVS